MYNIKNIIIFVKKLLKVNKNFWQVKVYFYNKSLDIRWSYIRKIKKESSHAKTAFNKWSKENHWRCPRCTKSKPGSCEKILHVCVWKWCKRHPKVLGTKARNRSLKKGREHPVFLSFFDFIFKIHIIKKIIPN